MTSRPASTLTVRRESFAFTGAAGRSTEPEVFTFERLPAAAATAVRSRVPVRPRKRATRVMYPAKVRMHLPPPERSRAKRALLLLALVLLWQVCTEEPCTEEPRGDAGPVGAAAAGDYRALLTDQSPAEPPAAAEAPAPDGSACLPRAQTSDGGAFEQSAGKSYMVALLVYHRLGNDS